MIAQTFFDLYKHVRNPRVQMGDYVSYERVTTHPATGQIFIERRYGYVKAVDVKSPFVGEDRNYCIITGDATRPHGSFLDYVSSIKLTHEDLPVDGSDNQGMQL